MAIGKLIEALPKRGCPVTGETFVGREQEIGRIMRDFLGSDGNNMAVYGLPRIGKTSIVKEVIRRYQESADIKDSICPVYLNLISVKGFTVVQIYYYILDGIWTILEEREMEESDLSYIRKPIEDVITYLQNGERVDPSLAVTSFQNFFYRCQRKGLSLRVVLDEYDSVMPTFIHQNVLDTIGLNAFNGAMRNIIDEDKYDTRILFITRNRLSEMEPAGVSSRLTGVCGEPLMIKPFSQNDVEEYWGKLSRYDTDGIINKIHKEKIAYYAGSNYPYWMNLVNDILFNAVSCGENETETTLKVAIAIRDEYKSVLDMLDASRYLDSGDGSLRSKLFQIVLGINYDVQPTDIDRLMNYGLLERDGDNSFKAISPFFHDYLDFQNMQTPVWQHLGRFEKSMRSLIKKYLAEFGYSLDEEKSLPAGFPTGLLTELKKRRNRMCGNFGNTSVSRDLVDYFFMSNYFELFVRPYWTWFSNVFVSFHDDLGSCPEQFHYLEQCRNAEGHFNGHFLNKEVIARVERYCMSLSEQADSFLSKKQ